MGGASLATAGSTLSRSGTPSPDQARWCPFFQAGRPLQCLPGSSAHPAIDGVNARFPYGATASSRTSRAGYQRRDHGLTLCSRYPFARVSRSWSSFSQLTGSFLPSRSIRRLAFG